MKKKLSLIFITALAIACLFAVSASATDVDGIDYSFSNGTATVTSANQSCTLENVVIPEKVTYDGTEYTVTKLDASAFYSNTTIKSVVIPSTVTSIGQSAFYGCSSLTEIDFPRSGLTTLGSKLFQNCKGLTNVRLPDTVTSIPQDGFHACSNLVSINIPRDCKTIGGYAFNSCSSLKTIIMESTVLKSTSTNSFGGCSTLEALEFPEGFTTFAGITSASSLKSVSLPNSVTSLGRFQSAAFTEFVVPAGVSSLGDKVFDYCSSLKKVTLPKGLTSVSTSSNPTFYGSTLNNLTEIVYTGSPDDAIVATLKTAVPKATITYANHCETYYKGVHEGDDGDCTTAFTCTRCGKEIAAFEEHNVTVNTLVYANGLGSTGVRNYICDNAGCSAVDIENENSDPIISAKGYSFKESDKTGLDGGYSINAKLLALYEELNGSAKIGIIIVNAEDAQKNGLVDESFKLISKMGVRVELTSREYSYFDLRITGFNTEELQKLGLIITSYVVDDFDGDGAEEIKYIQHKMSDANESPVTINGVVYNTVTVERAYKEKYPTEA